MRRRDKHGDRPPSILYLLTTSKSLVLVRGQLDYLVRHGFEVSLATSFEDSADSSQVDDGVHVFHIPFRRNPSLWADLQSLWAALRLIRKVRPDIVNASTPKAGLIGNVAAFLLRVPTRVYVVRGIRFETMKGRGRSILRFIEMLTMRLSTVVLFNSNSLRTLAVDDGVLPASRGVVLNPGSGNGVNIHKYDNLPAKQAARHTLNLDTSELVLGFVGRLTRDKGIEDLAYIWSQLRMERENLRLLLVGDFEEGDPVRPTVKDALLHDPRVTNIPWMNDPLTAYRSMDLLVFPSYREGLPNVPLEAQMSRLPVVAYSATGTVDALEHSVGGLTVPVGDVLDLHRAVSQLLSDDEERHRLGDGGRQWVADHFAQEKIWPQLLSLYQECLAHQIR